MQRKALEVIAPVMCGCRAPAIELVRWERATYFETSRVVVYLAGKRADGVPRYGIATQRRMVCALRGVLRTAWRLGLMSGDAYERAHDVRVGRGEAPLRGRHVSDTALCGMYRACDGSRRGARDAAILVLLHVGGLRRSEAVAVQLSDLRAESKSVQVRGKGDRSRVVPLEAGWWAIEQWLAVRGRREGFLITSLAWRRRSYGVTGRVLSTVVERLARVACVGHPVACHDLRRTAIGEFLHAEGDIRAAQRLLGHAKVETTLRYDQRGHQRVIDGQRRRWMRGREDIDGVNGRKDEV